MWRVAGTKAAPRVVNTARGKVYEVYPHQVDDLLAGGKSVFWHIRGYDGEPVVVQYGPDGPSLDDIHTDVTARCNMRCPHCYQSCGQDTRELSVTQFRSMCQGVARLGGARIALSGGEALLHSQFDELPKIIEEEGLVYTALFSNGFDPELAFRKSKPWTQVLFSHSPSMGQELTQDKLELIASLSEGRLVTLSSLTRDGSEVARLFDQIINLSDRIRGRLRWRVGVVRPVGRGTALSIDLPGVKAAYHEIFRRWVELQPNFDFQIGFAFRSDFVKHGRIDLYRENSRCCEYKEGSLCVKWDGRVTGCSMDEQSLGTVDDLEDVWARVNNTGFRAIRSKDIDACSNCSLRRTCNGGCRLCAARGTCDQMSKMTYEFLDEIMPQLRTMGVQAA